MAEFCLRCWNELNREALSPRAVVLSKRPERCEQCGALRPVVVKERRLRARRERRKAAAREN